jgi:hypothetical protein
MSSMLQRPGRVVLACVALAAVAVGVAPVAGSPLDAVEAAFGVRLGSVEGAGASTTPYVCDGVVPRAGQNAVKWDSGSHESEGAGRAGAGAPPATPAQPSVLCLCVYLRVCVYSACRWRAWGRRGGSRAAGVHVRAGPQTQFRVHFNTQTRGTRPCTQSQRTSAHPVPCVVPQ